MTPNNHVLRDAPGPTALTLIHELWTNHEYACPYLRHDERGCYCTSPRMRDSVDPYMPCNPESLQLWCLTEGDYTKCCLYPAGDVP